MIFKRRSIYFHGVWARIRDLGGRLGGIIILIFGVQLRLGLI
jgi:hypothetical protein